MATDDALTRYKSKRNFSITPEPAGGAAEGKGKGKDKGKGLPTSGLLTFVIQKHWASQLHYDFRLELDGTMKSWAVPKGPSVDSKIKRMAVHVEDHPISYSSFDGTIPAKQYGAGKVIIWDRGTWHPLGDPHVGYRDGNLKFELRGYKLRGRWVLVRMKGKSEKQEPWLLIKEKDEFVRSSSEFSIVDEQPDSVALLQADNNSAHPAAIARLGTGTGAGTKKQTTTKARRPKDHLSAEAIKAELPAMLAPQLATLVAGPLPDPQDWIYEIKFDGYRLLTRIDGADVRMFTRNGNDWTMKLAPLQKKIARLKLPPGWYDGEIVMPNENGVPDFGALQQVFDSAPERKPANKAANRAKSNAANDIVLYLFDVPYFDGYDMRAVPLEARRRALQRALEKIPSEQVRFSKVFDARPESVIASACALGLEGIIAKRRDSPYVSRRSDNWIKLKCSQRQEFVIAGYTDPQGARVGIGSLILGVHDDRGELHYAGNVGTGFSQRALQELKKKLEVLHVSSTPFTKSADIAGRPHWVKPRLVAEVSFAEWTRLGRIRHSVFHGLRHDKDASAIVRERATRLRTIASAAKVGVADKKSHHLSSRLRITNPERVIDTSTGTTKIELVRYYGLVGALIMAHLKGRPVSLVRAPSGVSGPLFFQKHAETEKLPGIRQLDPALDSPHPPMLELTAKQGLLSAAQWNVVEFHTHNAMSKSFDHPDRMVFDLDPGAGVAWTKIQEAAELVHVFLKQLGLTSFLKTSGGKGLHVVVPLRELHDWDTVKGFSQTIVAHLARTIPQRFVAKSGPKNRVGKIFIDYLRNGQGATTVCAWSARARPGLGISVPVEWRELKSLNGGDHWSVHNAHTRLDKGNEVWIGYRKAARSLTAAMKLLDYQPVQMASKRKDSTAGKQT